MYLPQKRNFESTIWSILICQRFSLLIQRNSFILKIQLISGCSTLFKDSWLKQSVLLFTQIIVVHFFPLHRLNVSYRVDWHLSVSIHIQLIGRLALMRRGAYNIYTLTHRKRGTPPHWSWLHGRDLRHRWLSTAFLGCWLALLSLSLCLFILPTKAPLHAATRSLHIARCTRKTHLPPFAW